MSLDTAPFREYAKRMKATLDQMSGEMSQELNRITDRHYARCVKNTPVGMSPLSPQLRNAWDRSGVMRVQGGLQSEVFNTAEHAPYYEFGHRQTPGRLVFIELRPGAQLYGQAARKVRSGKHAGKWGITIRLKKSFVKGAFVMTDSEKKAQRELDAATRRLVQGIRRRMG